jgi:hypothetical protein
VEWSLDGPLPKLCPVIPASNQDGRQAKNRKKFLRISQLETRLPIAAICQLAQNEKDLLSTSYTKHPDLFTNMAAIDDSYFWLVDF